MLQLDVDCRKVSAMSSWLPLITAAAPPLLDLIGKLLTSNSSEGNERENQKELERLRIELTQLEYDLERERVAKLRDAEARAIGVMEKENLTKAIQSESESYRLQFFKLQQQMEQHLLEEKNRLKEAEKRVSQLEQERNERKNREKEKENRQLKSSMTSKYEEVRELGKGAFGKVLLVRNKENEELAAAKLLPIDQDEEMNKEIRRELAAFAKLKPHKNLIKLIESFENDEILKKRILIFEFCPNGTLNDLILRNSGTLSLESKKSFMRDIMAGIVHIHRCDILHLDLKADNILLDEKRRVKISDFGIAKIFSKSRYESASLYYYTSCGVINMPRYFRPPEIFLAEDKDGGEGIKKATTFKVDIYQAGCTFLAMLLETKVKWNNEKELLAPYLEMKRGKMELATALLDDINLDKLFDKIEDIDIQETLRKMTDFEPKNRPNAEDVQIM